MRMSTAHRFAVASLGSGVALLLGAADARAQQLDTNPPLPNVLLLIDNSGSMERMINGNTPETDPNPLTPSGTNSCNCKDNGSATAATCDWKDALPAANRWGVVLESFGGTPTNGYGCVAEPRNAGANSTFVTEYQIAGVQPYDTNYYLPFHRMVTPDPNASGASSLAPGACVYAPGSLNGATTGKGVGLNAAGLGGAATDFTGSCASGVCTGSIVTQEYSQLSKPVSCTFAQNNDGALTQMKDLMRFGMMTFDTDPDPGIGVTTGANPQVGNAPFLGMWSYFPSWNTGGICPYAGNPAACASPTMMAVGARNPGAPAWEGRMVMFPSTNDIVTQEKNNAQIQEVLMATRPYGATPIAGMFTDASYYLFTDPAGPQKNDAFIQGGCRSEYVILLTDGAPNLDLQPSCSAGGSPAGKCPFSLPQTTAAAMYNLGKSIPGSSGQASVTTFVIGFAVSTVTDGATTAKCSQFAKGGALSGLCDCNNPALASYVDPTYGPIGPCCELQCIAQAGGSGSAYFADTQGDLQNALGAILGSIASNSTTRTTPSYSGVVANTVANQSTPTAGSSVFLASFDPAIGKPWTGDVQRQQSLCTFQSGNYTVTQSIQTASGDDFAADLNSHTGPARTFFAFQPNTIGGTSNVDSAATIRPYVATTGGDGLGRYSFTQFAGPAGVFTSGNITPGALNIPSQGCAYVSNNGGAQKYLTPAQCTSMVLDFTFGQPTFGGGPADFTFVNRYNNALGDIFHANPVAVGPPGTLLQDGLYVNYRQAWATRKQVLYVATNDGLLHAFWADENKLENNELWAMLPPAVMPNLVSSYPSSHEFLLDGSPVVKDVVWDRDSSTTASSVWHTTLVAGYGPYSQGYYAVDVTNPDPTGATTGGVPPDPGQSGPVFLWQLTKMPATNYPLFGSSSATPAITTLFMDPGDGHPRDIGVAILPGGQNGGPTSSLPSGSPCAREFGWPNQAQGYNARASVRCWGANAKATDPVVGRSVTIVRLDTGEILQTFARQADFAAYPNDTLATSRKHFAHLDSPMTGTPLVYPGDVGTDATKFFIGDADGTIWKFDVSSPYPAQWTVSLFQDLYNTKVDPNTLTSWGDGQPFQINPILSLDTSGRLVINAATGSIQTFDSTGLQYVYSMTETVQGSGASAALGSNVNWYLGPANMSPTSIGFQPGERVSGPMAVFNNVLYFSTYAAPPANQQSCSSGNAYLWGRDFVSPDVASDLSQGGRRILQPPPPATPLNPPPINVQPSSVQAGAVIPGVSIMASPACAGLGTASSDQYVAGATHQSPQNFAAGAFSLFSQVGAKGASGAGSTAQIQMSVPTPIAPTVIDSWAMVLE